MQTSKQNFSFNGDIDDHETADLWQESWLCHDHAFHCREIITDAAAIAAELIMTDRDETASRPFGSNVENLKDPEADQSNKVT